MLKKSITYTDFNDVERTEDFYFNLTKAELVELEMSESGGLSETLKQIVASTDGKGVIENFKKIILLAYGIKTPDGKFRKSKELSDDFASTGAYSELFVELATNEGSAAAFIKGVVPQGMPTEVPTDTVELPAEPAPPVLAETPVVNTGDAAPAVMPWEAEGRAPTDEEMASMTQEQLVQVLRRQQ